jgi:hypothetical protein
MTKKFRAQVFNENGMVLFYPNIANGDDFLQSLPPDPHAQSATQLFPLGTQLIQGERVWTYEKNGAGTLTPSMPLQGPVVQNAAASVDIVVDAASAIGSYKVSLTSQAAIAVAKDYYKEGYLFVNDGTGEGYTYKIKGHDALVSTTAGSIFTLYEPIITALVAGDSQIGLRKNPFDSVIVSAAPLTNVFAGIAPLDVTAYYYFWAQVGGPCATNAKSTTAILVGSMVTVGTTAGQVDVSAHDSTYGLDRKNVIIGYAMTPGAADGEKFLTYLNFHQ